MTTPKLHTWTRTADQLPPEGEEVIVLNGWVETTLVRRGRLWWLADGSMYVYYTPDLWRPLRAVERVR